MAKKKGIEEGGRAKKGTRDTDFGVLQDILNQPKPPETTPAEVASENDLRQRVAAATFQEQRQAEELANATDAEIVQPPEGDAALSNVLPPNDAGTQVLKNDFSDIPQFRAESRQGSVSEYDESGYPATQTQRETHSFRPKTRLEPQLGERAKKSKIPQKKVAPKKAKTPGFTKVETKPGLTWTEEVPAQVEVVPRSRRPKPVDEGPLTQVETKIPRAETDIGLELLPTMFGTPMASMVRQREAEEQRESDERIEAAHAAAETTGDQEPEPFDPHSVPSVDESNVQVPQYGQGDMQAEMNGLAEGEPAQTNPEVPPSPAAKDFLTQEEINKLLAGLPLSTAEDAPVATPATPEPEEVQEEATRKAVEAAAPRIEKTREEIAEENRHEALGVPPEFEDKELETVKLSHDLIRQLLKRMSEDPEVAFNVEDALFEYRVVLPERDKSGNLVARWEPAETYHDLLRMRATVPEDLRRESDPLVWEWQVGGRWGKIATVADTEKLWDRLSNPDDKLSKYRSEFYSLISRAKDEQLPDEYARAVARGEVVSEPPQVTIDLAGRREPTLGAEPAEADAEPQSGPEAEPQTGAEAGPQGNANAQSEGTPKEWRAKLRELIEGAKEKVEWWKSSEEHLIQRNAELDAQMIKIPGIGIERKFRALGEWYNKRKWYTKLAVGVGLGVGGGVSAAMMLPEVLAVCIGGAVVQRAAGLSTMFLKYEKTTQEGRWQREIALGKAIGYTAAMAGAMMLIAEGAQASAQYAKEHGWLGSMLGHKPAVEVPAPRPEYTVDTGLKVDDTVPAPPAGMPSISVEATKGKGYEYMMKRLWEQLQNKEIDSSKYAEGSDIRRLLEADASSIDKVVHQIAADHSHGFFNPDGTSVRIDLGSQMTINAEGNIQLGEVVKAPEGAPVTPPYHPDLPVGQDIGRQEVLEKLHSQAEQELVAQAPATPAETIDKSVATVDLTSAQDETATQSPAPVIEKSFVTNQFGLSVPIAEAHIYASSKGSELFVYGGSTAEQVQAISNFLAQPENRFRIIYAADTEGTRVPWFCNLDGKIVQGLPMHTKSGPFGLFSTPVKPPGPEELAKLIK